MNFKSPSQPPVFNLLSIGQRGVGKTVFLAGSYAELNAASDQAQLHPLWFESQSSREKDNLEGILNYVAQTGQYPPPTMKITDFNFVLKRRDRRGTRTLCYFRWCDIPGEYCNFEHPEFQQMVLTSQSCCVFINAHRLVYESQYLESLDAVVKQVISIANLLDKSITQYRFALIFTQCDRLANGPIGRLQIEEHLLPLITGLEAASACYQRFYSAVPIVEEADTFKLKPIGAAAAFLWLVSQLQQSRRSPSSSTLATSLKTDVSPLQYWLNARPKIRGKWLAIGLGVALLMAVIVSAIPNLIPNFEEDSLINQQIRRYEETIQRNPDDFNTLVILTNLYLEQGQTEKAISLMEKIVQLKPDNLDWQFNLAKLYELVEQKPKAEQVYDRILTQDSQQFKALLAKALLRQEQGDRATAQRLFQQAEQVAPSKELKAKIRQIAQDFKD